MINGHSQDLLQTIDMFCMFFFILIKRFNGFCIGLSRYIAITNLPIIAVFVEYLRQFLIDFKPNLQA